jgi:hypothetical protein
MLSRQYRVPAVDINKVTVDSQDPEAVARRHRAQAIWCCPLRRVGRTLTVAMANPADPGAIDQLKFVTRHDIEPVVVGEFTLKKHIDKYYGVQDADVLADCWTRSMTRTWRSSRSRTRSSARRRSRRRSMTRRSSS